MHEGMAQVSQADSSPKHLPSLPGKKKGQPTVWMTTYGCQMNVLDSELVLADLFHVGFEQVDSCEQADVILLNTCSIREAAEHKVWSQLGRLRPLKAAKPHLILGVLGCMAEREGRVILERMPHVDLLCGPSDLGKIPAMVHALRSRSPLPQIALAGHTSRRSSTLEQAATQELEALDQGRIWSDEQGHRSRQAYVRITRGCNKFCSFCVVPYTRGAERHRSPQQLLQEVQRLVQQGVVEVTLLGQTINHYTWYEGGKRTSFADLLALLHDGIPELARLRFVTSYPRDFTDDILDVMAASPRICKYIHLPAQSGSNTVLKRMNRGYTVEAYLALLERARQRMPHLALSGDMIAGFCGETEQDHQASLDLLRQARYKNCFIFKYSPRSGTLADKRLPDDVPEACKKIRNQELLQLQAEISAEHHQQLVGHHLDVLVEGYNKLQASPSATQRASQMVQLPTKSARQTMMIQAPDVREQVRLVGRTSRDEIVAFDGPADLVGQQVTIHSTGATALTVFGTWTGSLCPTSKAYVSLGR